MSNKRVYIVIMAIIFVFFLVMFALFGIDNIKKSKYSTTLIVGDNTVWSYSKGKWLNLSNSSFENLYWDEYKVYVNNKKAGTYQLWHSDKWYAFDSKKNPVTLDGDLLAYKSNHKIPVYSFKEEDITDNSSVIQVLESNNLDASSKFTSYYKVSIDYDNDGEKEEFYLISNAFPMDFDPERIFSIVYMVDGDNIYPIYTDISQNTSFNGCKPYFKSFLDVDNDNKTEFVLSCSGYSVSNTIDMLYQFIDGEFKIVISSQ